VAFIDDGLEALTSLRGVANLNLQGCTALTDKGLRAIAHMTSLTSVNLQDCRQISGARPPSDCLLTFQLVYVGQKICSVCHCAHDKPRVHRPRTAARSPMHAHHVPS
jgi:hypothetical protein